MELAGIFGWDIDFALDIRRTTASKSYTKEKVVEGEVVGLVAVKIMAAVFKKAICCALDDERHFDEMVEQ